MFRSIALLIALGHFSTSSFASSDIEFRLIRELADSSKDYSPPEIDSSGRIYLLSAAPGDEQKKERLLSLEVYSEKGDFISSHVVAKDISTISVPKMRITVGSENTLFISYPATEKFFSDSSNEDCSVWAVARLKTDGSMLQSKRIDLQSCPDRNEEDHGKHQLRFKSPSFYYLDDVVYFDYRGLWSTTFDSLATEKSIVVDRKEISDDSQLVDLKKLPGGKLLALWSGNLLGSGGGFTIVNQSGVVELKKITGVAFSQGFSETHDGYFASDNYGNGYLISKSLGTAEYISVPVFGNVLNDLTNSFPHLVLDPDTILFGGSGPTDHQRDMGLVEYDFKTGKSRKVLMNFSGGGMDKSLVKINDTTFAYSHADSVQIFDRDYKVVGLQRVHGALQSNQHGIVIASSPQSIRFLSIQSSNDARLNLTTSKEKRLSSEWADSSFEKIGDLKTLKRRDQSGSKASYMWLIMNSQLDPFGPGSLKTDNLFQWGRGYISVDLNDGTGVTLNRYDDNLNATSTEKLELPDPLSTTNPYKNSRTVKLIRKSGDSALLSISYLNRDRFPAVQFFKLVSDDPAAVVTNSSWKIGYGAAVLPLGNFILTYCQQRRNDYEGLFQFKLFDSSGLIIRTFELTAKGWTTPDINVSAISDSKFKIQYLDPIDLRSREITYSTTSDVPLSNLKNTWFDWNLNIGISMWGDATRVQQNHIRFADEISRHVVFMDDQSAVYLSTGYFGAYVNLARDPVKKRITVIEKDGTVTLGEFESMAFNPTFLGVERRQDGFLYGYQLTKKNGEVWLSMAKMASVRIEH